MSQYFELPEFRSDLEILPLIGSDPQKYCVKDSASEGVYLFGEEECFLAKQMDGKTTVPEIRMRFEQYFHLGIDLIQLDALINFMVTEGLLARHGNKQTSIWSLFQYQSPEKWKRWKILDPGKIFAAWIGAFGWLFKWPFLFMAAIAVLLAAGVLFNNFNDFLSDAYFFFSDINFVEIMVIVWLFLNLPCEFARGVTSAHFGARCEEFGIWLAYNVVPRFYCIARLWLIKDKMKRVLILSAPALSSLLVTSCGLLIWKISSPGILLHKLGVYVAVLGAIDLFVRINILWPTEAYYVLANWIDAPDLRRRAISVARAWFFRRPLPEPLTPGKNRFFKWYGLLTASLTLPSYILVICAIGWTLITKIDGPGALMFLAILAVKYRNVYSALIGNNKILSDTN